MLALSSPFIFLLPLIIHSVERTIVRRLDLLQFPLWEEVCWTVDHSGVQHLIKCGICAALCTVWLRFTSRYILQTTLSIHSVLCTLGFGGRTCLWNLEILKADIKWQLNST